MRVALDFYRILMVPLQVEAEVLQAAYRERIGQELWRGFSERALQSRRHLLNEAYGVLSDPAQRLDYDTHLKAVDPGLDLLPQQTPGALVVLCELGDYEGAIAAVDKALTIDEGNKDYLLARAIARLATGRDLWQQRDYEGAAKRLHRANDELMQHHSFPEMQAEIRSDLNRLRPYRILELLAREELDSPERKEGLKLLKALLDERMGIEGKGVDGSGLTMEDALRFIQKARSHMTLTEQHDLFEIEADRPSLVAGYLASYALMTRGYIEHRPLLLRRARGRLVKLVQRHDVYVEQAICTMLLGQPDEALRLMQLSRDEHAAKTIKSLSGDRKDLLLGLCRYTEGWFKEDVFPEYRALDGAKATLNAYFEDPQVQAYLEAMPTSTEEAEQLDRQARALEREAEMPRDLDAVAKPPARPKESDRPIPPATAAKPEQSATSAAATETTLVATAGVATAVAARPVTVGAAHSATTDLSTNGVAQPSSPDGPGYPSNGSGYPASNGSTASWMTSTRSASDFMSDTGDAGDRDAVTSASVTQRPEREDAWIPAWLWKVGGAAIATLLVVAIARGLTTNRPSNDPVETATEEASAAPADVTTGAERDLLVGAIDTAATDTT
ncbi:MAG: J domain-containing protein, partial [Cyanobacteria bacterium J06648_11]